jgi:hypothetical protein
VSSKKIFVESGIPSACWLWVPAPLMPEVALVELPPMKLQGRSADMAGGRGEAGDRPLLVKKEDVRAALEESVRSRETCETATDDDDLCHCNERGRYGV